MEKEINVIFTENDYLLLKNYQKHEKELEKNNINAGFFAGIMMIISSLFFVGITFLSFLLNFESFTIPIIAGNFFLIEGIICFCFVENTSKNIDKYCEFYHFILDFYTRYHNHTFIKFINFSENEITYSYLENNIIKTASLPITDVEERMDIDHTQIVISNDLVILQKAWTKGD